ncbi:hypothetical protein NP493_1795g00028 [Ridgeia piscesae]|uniref:Uncharacterized protein n=1 Tax=Ridgeia piscesae TaxID=27915 RepID=A0AAD9JSN5_RIDPI|nr:hypothetical protein NP493_1795g00028 [Ridgeia piscesae]
MMASWRYVIATLSWLLLATVAAPDVCTLETDFKDDDFPCRKWLHCRQPIDWTSLSAEIKTKSDNDRLCAIVVDCANTITISNFDFQAIGGRFDRVLNVTIARCNATQVRLADDMYFVVEVDLNGNAVNSLDVMQQWKDNNFEEFEILHFYRNTLSSVRKSDFAEFYQLTEVRLDSNIIVDVEAGSFDKNQKLDSINLANNRIVNLRKDMFKNIKTLKSVQLASNKITTLDAGVFLNIHLQSLDLSHNDITTVPNSAFIDTSVALLKLSSCQIRNIPSGFLSSLRQNLTTLDLSNNDIGSLTSDAFVHLSQLRVIFLTGNKLTTIEQSMFPQGISEIHLKSDSFRCCRLLWLQTLVKGTISGDDVMCVYPFAARLSQYLESSFNCAAPEVFPMTTAPIDTTSTLASCVAWGVPTPNVTLKTDDGAYVADAVGATSVAVNLNVSVSLRLPDTTVLKYQLVLIVSPAMAGDNYEHLGAVGGHRDSRVYAKLQTPKATESEYVSMDNIGKSRDAVNHECGHPVVTIAGKEIEPSVEDDSVVYAKQQAQQTPATVYESLDKTSRSRSGDDHEYGRLDVATAGKGRTSFVNKGQRSGKRRTSSKDRYVDMPRRANTIAPGFAGICCKVMSSTVKLPNTATSNCIRPEAFSLRPLYARRDS